MTRQKTKALKQSTETATADSATTSKIGANVPPMAAMAAMTFACSKKELQAAVKRLACVADRRSSMPMLANIALRASRDSGVVLAATDLNLYGVITCPAFNVTSAGSATVNAKALGDLLGKLPDGEITIAATIRGIEITHGAAKVSLDGLPARDFPKLPAVLPDDPMVPWTQIDASALKTALSAVAYAVCKDETRFHLNGVFVEYEACKLVTVATDGHRLAKYQALVDRKGDFKTGGMILPQKAVKEIGKLLGKGECDIAIVSSMFAIRYKGTTLVAKAIDAQFPPYEQVIPKDHSRLVTVDRKALIGALGRAKLVCTETRGARLELLGETLTVASDNPDAGETRETLAAECKPSDVKFAIGCRASYLIDACEALDCERVTLAFDPSMTKIKGSQELVAALNPILVRSTEDAIYHRVVDATLVGVVMPMRI